MEEIQEIDEEKEFIENILKRIGEENFITTNYLLVEEGVLNFSCDEISEKEFLNILDQMKEIIRVVQDGYENAYMNLDSWTLEISTGDRMFREGIKEWEEGLNFLYEYCEDMDEEKIHRGIKKIYEGNKKLIINQEIEAYVDEQVKMPGKEGISLQKDGIEIKPDVSSSSCEKIFIHHTVTLPGSVKKEPEKSEEKLSSSTSVSVHKPSIKTSGKCSEDRTVYADSSSIKTSEACSEEKTVDTDSSSIKTSEACSEDRTVDTDSSSIKTSEACSEEKTVSPAPDSMKNDREKTATEGVTPVTDYIESTETVQNELKLPEEKVSEIVKTDVIEEEPLHSEIPHEEEKNIRKPAGLSKRIRKSSHSKRSDLFSDNPDKEDKSSQITGKETIRRPAGLTRKAGKK